MCKFYLGTCRVGWLWDPALAGVPLFVSRRGLTKYKNLKPALTDWCLDSGGFSELTLHGKWTVDAPTYAAEVRRFSDEIGRLQWASIQDWMCEPWILENTGLTVAEHQMRTVNNYEDLLNLEPDLPWTPVLQGWESDDYMRHLDLYAKRGFDLTQNPVVGVGSVCRRQRGGDIVSILNRLECQGLNLHGFGIKLTGLKKAAKLLVSADSMSWSYAARRSDPLPGCTHKSCNNCKIYALRWHQEVLTCINSALNAPFAMVTDLWDMLGCAPAYTATPPPSLSTSKGPS